MSDKRAPRRSLDDWVELVTECRQSGLTVSAYLQTSNFRFCIIFFIFSYSTLYFLSIPFAFKYSLCILE